MSDTNFMSYTNAQSVLGGFANAIKGKDDPYTTISYADWLELTDQEKESGKYYITGAPGADGSIQVDLMTKLWENPSPTDEFAAQDITLNSSDYDLLIIIYKRYAGGNIAGSLIIPKNESIEIEACSPESSGARTHTRQANVSSNGTIISWDSSYMTTGTSSYTVNNNGCVPTAIYGIKTIKTIRLNAIASDVSTSADKCMLSDGVTSVEDALQPIIYKQDSTITGKGTMRCHYSTDKKVCAISATFTASASASNSPSIGSIPVNPKINSALSCIDITNGIGTSITSAQPCGIGTNGTIYIKEIVNGHIYSISGTCILN